MKAVVILGAAALAACGSEPSVKAENASVAEVQAKIEKAGGQAVFLSPGRWESSVRIDKVEIPGMPAELAQRMQKAVAGTVSASCLTPEEAKKPAAEFFGGKDRRDCRYEHFTMSDGKLDAKLTCGGEGGAATVAMKGDYSPDRFQIAMTTEAKAGTSGPGAMTMSATVDSKRTGACTAKEEG